REPRPCARLERLAKRRRSLADIAQVIHEQVRTPFLSQVRQGIRGERRTWVRRHGERYTRRVAWWPTSPPCKSGNRSAPSCISSSVPRQTLERRSRPSSK